MLLGILLAAVIVICIALVGVILLQRSEGGVLGMSGGGPGNFMSVRGTGDLLTRTTQILAGIFFVLCLVMTLVTGHIRRNTELTQGLKNLTLAPQSGPAGRVLGRRQRRSAIRRAGRACPGSAAGRRPRPVRPIGPSRRSDRAPRARSAADGRLKTAPQTPAGPAVAPKPAVAPRPAVKKPVKPVSDRAGRRDACARSSSGGPSARADACSDARACARRGPGRAGQSSGEPVGRVD